MPAQNDLLQTYIDREPAASGGRAREFATLKAGIHAHHSAKQVKPLTSYIRLLMAAQKSHTVTLMAAAVSRDSLSSALDVFCAALTTIVSRNPVSTLRMTVFCRLLDSRLPIDENIFHYVWRELIGDVYPDETVSRHLDLLKSRRPAKAASIERDFYLSADDPDRPEYESLLAAESGSGPCAELIALCKLHARLWQHDPIYYAQFSRLINALVKQQSTTDTASDVCTMASIEELGAAMRDMYRDFTPNEIGWQSAMAAKLNDLILREGSGPPNPFLSSYHTWTNTRKRTDLCSLFESLLRKVSDDSWYEAALALVTDFASIVPRIIEENLSASDVLQDQQDNENASR